MSKDHTPGGFHRASGYKSDLEIAEENGKRINTSFGSGNHNVYVHHADHTHEHFWYDPENCQSGYHGANVVTANNHPSLGQYATGTEENIGSAPATGMSDSVEDSMEDDMDSGRNLDDGEDCEDGMDI